MSFTRLQWAKDLANQMGNANPSPRILAFIVGWSTFETNTNSGARFNLLNTTQPGIEGSTNFNSAGVKNFPNYQSGIQATIVTLRNGYYTHIEEGIRDNVESFFTDSPDEEIVHELHTWSGNPNGYGENLVTTGASHLQDVFDYGNSPYTVAQSIALPTGTQRSEAIDCWNSFFGELGEGHSAPPIDTGIFNSWLNFWIHGHVLGCPLTYEYDSHDWNNKPLKCQQFSHARAEWDGMNCHWYSINGEVKL